MIHLIKSFKMRNKIIYLTFLLVSIIFTSLNQGGSYIIHFIDILWPFHPILDILNFFNVWNRNDFGYVTILNIFNLQSYLFISLLYLINLPIFIQQIIIISMMEFLASIFYFKIFNEFLFYNYNFKYKEYIIASSVMILTIGPGNYYLWDFIPQGEILLGFGAMFLYYELKLFESYITNQKMNFTYIMFLFISSFFSFSVNVPFNLSLVLLSLILPIYLIIIYKFKEIIRIFYYFLFLLLFIIVPNLWWILPSYLQYKAIPNLLVPSYTLYVSINFLDSLRFLYNVYSNNYAHTYFVRYIYYNVGNIMSYIPIILILLTLFFKFKNKIIYFFTLFIYIFFSLIFMGIKGPFDNILLYLISTNGIFNVILRNTATAFVFFYIFIITLIMLLSIFEILSSKFILKKYLEKWNIIKNINWENKINFKKIIVIFIIIIILTTSFSLAPQNFLGDASPHYPFRARMIVPEYEYQVADFLNKYATNSYALLYPGGFLEQNWSKNGYDAYDILPALADKALLITHYGQYVGQNYNWMLDYIYTYISSQSKPNSTFANLLYTLNIKYIVIEGEIGGNYPFSFYPPPNYEQILNKLNNTKNIKLVQRIGPDYIYESALEYKGLIGIAKKLYSNKEYLDGFINLTNNITLRYYNYNNSAIEGFFNPINNITLNYYNYSKIKSDVYILNSTYMNGIYINLNSSYKNYLQNLSLPYGLIYANALPLHINSSAYQYLVIRIRANNNTAFSISGLTTDVLNITNLRNASNYAPLIPNDNYGWGNNQKIMEAYGGDHFYSNNRTMTFIINLEKALPGNKELNYLIFGIYPVANNGSGLRGVPLNQWPNNQTLLIQSIELGQVLDPPLDVFYSSENISLNVNITLSYRYISPEEYIVNVSGINSSLPILIVLHQTYSKYWIIKNKNTEWKSICLDNGIQGFLIYPENQSNLKIEIYYSLQDQFNYIMYIVLLIYILFFLMAPIIINKKYKN